MIPDPKDVAFGQAMLKRRQALGLTQENVGFLVGVSNAQIQRYEAGSNRVSISAAHKIANALRCKVGDLADEPGLPPN